MRTSESIAKIVPALVKAQASIGPAAKSAKNPHFKNRYATLGDIFDACRSALLEQGITVIQTGDGSESESATINTVLMHLSGEWIAGSVVSPLDRKNAQGVGSALTYLRRYGLASLLGIVADDDDDGNAAVASGPVWPIGGDRGKPVAEVSEETLTKAIAWGKENNRADIVKLAETELTRRNG